MVVYLLSSSPKNGVEIMDGVESITRGWWRPTPGSIYPLLKEMTDQGIVKKRDDGRYELTQKGRDQGQMPFGPRMRRVRSPDEVVGQMNNLVSYLEDAKSSSKESLDSHRAALAALSKRISNLAEDEKADKTA
jgi:DNA-binding PadR family transcriptional regulator